MERAISNPSEGRFMKIYVKSNFVVPGLVNGEFIDLDRSQLTIGEFLKELAEKAPTRVEYVRPGTQTIDPDEWEIKINDIPYPKWRGGLETFLKDGDTVTIIIVPLGGG
jgi:molybdopterin converting factor small subunit